MGGSPEGLGIATEDGLAKVPGEPARVLPEEVDELVEERLIVPDDLEDQGGVESGGDKKGRVG
jgi:hypothetical protein